MNIMKYGPKRHEAKLWIPIGYKVKDELFFKTLEEAKRCSNAEEQIVQAGREFTILVIGKYGVVGVDEKILRLNMDDLYFHQTSYRMKAGAKLVEINLSIFFGEQNDK